MNICIISSGTKNDSIPPVRGGGIQNYIFSISSYLASQGHNITIFTKLSSNNLKKDEIIKGVHIKRIKVIESSLFSTIFFSFKLLIKLKKLIRKRNIQIIHVNSRVSASIIRFFFPNIPLIFTEHNWDILFAPVGFTTSPIIHSFILLFELLSLRLSSCIICLSSSSCTRIKSLLRKPKNFNKIIHIPNIINLELIKDFNRNLDQTLINKEYFIYIGRLEKEKNLELLIDSFAKINPNKYNVHLYIIGNGTLENKLINQINDLNVDEYIKIIKDIQNKDKFSYLKNCKSLILPSFYEIMPTVVLEAFAFKIPVIASKIKAHEELINNKINGYLFNPKNGNELSKILNFVIDNNKNLKEMGENAFMILKEKYSIDIVSNKLVQVYKKFTR